MTELVLRGILPALATPFTADAERVDETALTALVTHVIDAGVGGVIPCGSTGQYGALSTDERRRIVEVVVDASAGAVPVIPHTGASTTKAAVELTQHAQEAGASAVLVTPPAHVSWESVVAHFTAVAGSTDLPIMLYHIPETTGVTFDEAGVAELAEIANVRWMKDSSGDIAFVTELIQRAPEGFQVFNGADSLTFAGFTAGAEASVWGMANFLAAPAVELYQAAVVDKDLVKAREIWAKIWPVTRLVDTSDDYVAAVRAATELVGIKVGPARLPVRPPSDEFIAELKSALAFAGLL